MTDTQIIPQQLDPLTFPLHGGRLIEASAGTGKTYTITALYLRLLLGHGSAASAREIPLSVAQILVVTFTEAATEELRERIRARIQQAHAVFMGEPSKDDFLLQLKADSDDPESAARLMELAARQMDEAAIFTIHGFCQRMLKQHAFESGSLFETELITDDKQLQREALLDVWRRLMYQLPEDLAQALLTLWNSPDSLLKELRPYLSAGELQLQPSLEYSDLLNQWQASQQRLAAFCQHWQADSGELAALIQASGVNKNSYRKTSVPNWLAQIDRFASGERSAPPDAELERFRQSVLAEKTPSGKVIPEHPLFERCDQYFAERLPLREIVLTRVLQEIKQRFSQLKQARRQLSFDDLLSQLDHALQSDLQRSGQLRRGITAQFPVALIDEFQDTDPQQYRIFSSLYNRDAGVATEPVVRASACADLGLFMIGDPKQAIYGFRGADIFTYMQARRAVTAHYTLGTNWRSSSAMIAAVNTLFQRADSPFIYNQDIPFLAVNAGHRADKTPLRQGRTAPAALTVWYPGAALLSRKEYLQQFAQACAAQIAEQLAAGAEGQLLIGDQPLQAKDIAVLVRDRGEAAAVRAALADRQVPSVYLSSRDSVFDSQEALDLKLILQAIQEPQDERRLRAALATGLLNYPAQFLERLNLDEQLWEALVAEFTAYRDCWLKLGVLPMLRRLMQQRQLAEALLASEQGERRLTDLLHLGELLQKISLELDSIAGLLRWFDEQLQQPNGDSDEQRLRLESDSHLVTVITVHKSKGLEYPLVYLPFACSFRAADQAVFHDEAGRNCADLTNSAEHRALADKERLAEDLRLLYVALTRSIHACYIGVANIPDGRSRSKSGLHRSALGYLLLNGADNSEALEDQLQSLQAQCAAIRVVSPPLGDVQRALFGLAQPQAVTYRAIPFARRLRRDWRMSSYSALVSHGSSYLPALPGLDLEVVDEAADNVSAVPEQQDIFSFPKGAQAGTFLHEVFELLDFTQRDTVALQALLAERCQLAGYDADWIPVLMQLVDDVLQCPLDESGLCLGQIENRNKLVEMEFMLPARGLDAVQLNRTVQQLDRLSAHAGELDFEPLRGMLKGFIDLVFEHQGRYYILDYKSNHLGDQLEHYQVANLEQAMLEHRYDLQYQLYCLALHRLLASRLPDYDYQQHFGGVFYLFLRGMRAGVAGQGVFQCRPELALVEALDRLFSGTEAA